jgi:hypothetical protein
VTLVPLVVSRAVRSNTSDAAAIPAGTATVVGATETAIDDGAVPGANETLARRSALAAVPPVAGDTSVEPGRAKVSVVRSIVVASTTAAPELRAVVQSSAAAPICPLLARYEPWAWLTPTARSEAKDVSDSSATQ